MTRKERMFAAFRRQPVDRVPFATYNLHPFSRAHTGDATYGDLLALVWEHAGMLCKTGLTRRPGGTAAAAARRTETVREPVADGERVTTILHTPGGDLRSVTVKPADQPSLITEHYIKTDADIDTYMTLPYEPDGFTPEPAATVDRDLEGRGVAYVGYGDPMHAAAVLFDFSDFAIRCVTDAAPVRRLIDFFFEREQATLQNQLDACRGHDFLFYTAGPELCTPPMLSPEVFAQLVTPYQTRLIRMIHDAGFPVSIHCHGRVRGVLDEIIRTGADVLEPAEPPPQGDIGLGELLDRAGAQLCVMGYIQDQEFHHAPAGTMRRRVEEIARLVERRPGYVMTPTCTPFQHPAAPTFRRNYVEWVEVAAALLG